MLTVIFGVLIGRNKGEQRDLSVMLREWSCSLRARFRNLFRRFVNCRESIPLRGLYKDPV